MASPFVISAKFTLDGAGVASTAGEIRGQFQSIESAVTATAASMQRMADQRQRLSAMSAAGINSALGVRDDFGTERRAADIAAYGQALDEMRARYNPLFAAEQRHEANLAGIRRAQQLGAISSREAATAIRLEGAAYGQAVAQINSNTEAVQRNAAMRAGSAGGANGQFATANIAAQFQDIAVTSAMGMSPLQIALQQGTQISAAFGNMGAAGAVRTLGAAFLSIISPVSLVTIGLVAGGAAAIQYFSGLGQGAQDADERLDEHLERIEQIARGYDQAIDAAEDYIERSQRAPEASVAANLGADRTDALKEVDEALAAIANKNDEIATDFMSWQSNRMIHADLIETMQELGDLGITAHSTQGEIDALHTGLTNLSRDNSAPQQAREYANDLLALMEQLKLAQIEVESLGASLDALPSNIAVKLDLQMEGFNTARGKLLDLMPDFRTSFDRARDQAAEYYAQERGDATDAVLRTQAAMDYQAVLAGIDRQEAETEAKRTARSAKEVSAYDRQIEAIRERTAQQEMETNVIGLGTYASERARMVLELENAARKDAIGLTPKRVAAIQQEASAYALAAAQHEALLEKQQADQERYDFYKGTFRSFAADIKSGVEEGAEAIGSLHDDLMDKIGKNSGAGVFKAAVEDLQDSISAGSPAFDEFEQQVDAIAASNPALASVAAELKRISDDARQAADGWNIFGEAGANALDRIADRALGMMADGIFDMLFGAVMGGITGGFGGGMGSGLGGVSSITGSGGGFFPGFDQGGWTGGVRGQVRGAVHGEEFVVRAGPAAQHRQLLETINAGGSPNGAGPVVNNYNTINAQGSRMSRAEFEAILDARDRRQAAGAPTMMADARHRAVRGSD
ncbi:MAG TPA: phage tail length tape measure family protein [Devosia sp.]|jgi:hypothetical protein|nr:phage tail length tape measure family protein [Devosia sp.]